MKALILMSILALSVTSAFAVEVATEECEAMNESRVVQETGSQGSSASSSSGVVGE